MILTIAKRILIMISLTLAVMIASMVIWIVVELIRWIRDEWREKHERRGH